MTMLPRVPLHSFTVLGRAGELWGKLCTALKD